jgi:hypothetical protein
VREVWKKSPIFLRPTYSRTNRTIDFRSLIAIKIDFSFGKIFSIALEEKKIFLKKITFSSKFFEDEKFPVAYGFSAKIRRCAKKSITNV